MSLTAEDKKKVIAEYRRDENDSGSPEVQVAVLTHRIKGLTEHLKKHKHDYSSQRGLQLMVADRTKLLKYLRNTNRQGYQDLIAKLGLRK